MRKRIVLLIKGLGRGGAEQLLVNAAPIMDTRRFDYHIAYLLPEKDALVSDLKAVGLPVICLDGGHGIGWIRRLRGLVRERRIDLVHTHSPYPAVGARLALGPRKPRFVHTEHNVWESYSRATYWGNLITYFRNDHVFAVSRNVLQSVDLPRFLGFMPRPPIETLYHGPAPAPELPVRSPEIIRQELNIPDGALIVGTVANLKAKKGYPYLLRAAAVVRKELRDVRFVIVGQGPDEPFLRSEAHRLGLDRTVVFTGFREDPLRVAAAFDVFALPSLYEGLSIALIEAMSLGKPSVVTRTGGVPEVVTHGKHGLIVSPGDSDELAAALLTLLTDRTLRSRMGQAATRRAARFDIRSAVRRMEEVYEEVLS
jgi:glycosyltransferase involved in cell wall biosynthesis